MYARFDGHGRRTIRQVAADVLAFSPMAPDEARTYMAAIQEALDAWPEVMEAPPGSGQYAFNLDTLPRRPGAG